MSTISIIENGRSKPLVLDKETIAAIQDLRFRKLDEKLGAPVLSVEISRVEGAVHLVARDIVGSVRVRGLQIAIRPKCGARKLAHMLIESGVLPRQSPEMVLVESGDLVRFIVERFLLLVDDYVKGSIAEGYVRVVEVGVRPRGRIDFAWNRGGLPLPIRYEFEEFTENVFENRLIATALESVLGTYGFRDVLGEKASLLREHFGIGLAGLDDLDQKIDESEQTGLLQTLMLARTIVRGAGIEPEAGNVAAVGILFWMPSVYEGYVASVVRRAALAVGLHVDLKGNEVRGYTAAGEKLRLFPDFIVTQNGRPIIVGDMKYKLQNKTPPRSDIYQMFAYSEIYKVKSSIMLYVGPEGSTSIILNNAHETFLDAISLDMDNLEVDQVVGVINRSLRAALIRAGVLVPASVLF